MRDFFKNPEHQFEFDKFGYIVIPAFSARELMEIKSFYSIHSPEIANDFYSSIDSRDVNHRQQVDLYLKSFFVPVIEKLLINYLPLAANFIVKRGANSAVYDHTDHCLTDETKYTSVTIWAPLVDTNIINGAIRVLPGSHKIPDEQRGFGIPYRFDAFADAYSRYMILKEVKAGEALIYDPRLIHNSYPNLSGKDRPAIITGSIPQQAPARVFFRYEGLNNNECEEFEVNVEFWNRFEPGKRPIGYKSLGVKKYEPTSISKEELLSYVIDLRGNHVVKQQA